jgi:hypothetical protein
MAWSCATSAALASAAVVPASRAFAKTSPIPYEVFIPQDFAARIACRWSAGIGVSLRIRFTTFEVEPGIRAKSTTHVGP